ncbi:hypothetical protein A6F53_11980 [Levilactobacillus brevis]|uniref:hypothetical protein n=1 Tax=Levilactobacillus brevis TaxID=1580 RepID=UPI0007F88799|nr:hypothetical protein [Levilactobacillus brevis]ANN49925.1 hypothetical protein A6F53_11980 [Levilactobacillus brevis]
MNSKIEVLDELKQRVLLTIQPLTLDFKLSTVERNEILNDDFLLLLSIIADQSVHSSIAWHVVSKLKTRLNCDKLTPNYLLNHQTEVKCAMKQKPALHRFPDKMTKYFISLSQILVDQYGGHASELLNSRSFPELIQRLVQIKGISRKKAGLTCLILEIDEGQSIEALNKSYALMDSHVCHFLETKMGMNAPVSERDATEVFRTIYPRNPALVSTIVWESDKLLVN